MRSAEDSWQIIPDPLTNLGITGDRASPVMDASCFKKIMLSLKNLDQFRAILNHSTSSVTLLSTSESQAHHSALHFKPGSKSITSDIHRWEWMYIINYRMEGFVWKIEHLSNARISLFRSMAQLSLDWASTESPCVQRLPHSAHALWDQLMWM